MKRQRVYSEKWLEMKLAEALTRNGLANFHMSAPALPGIPDRYVIGASGMWIECKQGSSFAEMSRDLDRQRRFLMALDKGGDFPAVCALLQRPGRMSVLFLEPFFTWRAREISFHRKGQWDKRSPIWQSPLKFTEANEMAIIFDHFCKTAGRV